jgi:predicted permease
VPRQAAETALQSTFSALIANVELPAQRSGLDTAARDRFAQRRIVLDAGTQGQRPERGELSQALLLLFSVTGLVLLIACANVANLMLTRGVTRSAETAVRLSLGASRRRVVCQALIEACVLAVLGTAGGVLVGAWIVDAAGRLLPATGMLAFRIDARMLAFSALAALMTALLCGMYPAVSGANQYPAPGLRAALSVRGAVAAGRLRSSLATIQVALSVALLIVAGLLVKSLINVGHVSIGMDVDSVATLRVSPHLNGYSQEQARIVFERIEAELAALPGVAAVTTSARPILAGVAGGSNLTVEGFTPGADADTRAFSSRIGTTYFAALGIPLLAGREFTPADRRGAPLVAIVNEAFARKFRLGRDVVGRRMATGAGGRDFPLNIEIVGLVADARYAQVKEPSPPQYFLPYRQFDRLESLNFYVRSSRPAGEIAATLPAAVARIDATLPVENLRTLRDQLGVTLGLDRLLTALAAGFAASATLLAGLGLYGVLSFTVARRTREIGVRVALGATAARIRGLVVSQVGRVTVAGCGLGVAAAVALGRLARAFLFETSAVDGTVMVVAAAGMALVALAAAWLPARQATSLDPIAALRVE